MMFAATTGLSLAGCTNGDISNLKDQVINGTSYTIGQVFDHRKACDSVSWKESKDDRDRTIIEYQCNFSMDNAPYQQEQQKELDQLQQRIQLDQQGFRDNLAKEPQRIANAQKIMDEGGCGDLVRCKQDIADEQRNYQQALANESQSLADIQNRTQADIDRLKSLGYVTGITDIYRWVVNDDGTTLVFSGFDLTMSSGQVLHRSYGGNPWYPVTLMVRNNPTYFDMYKP
jgi:hypothetical protein